jgi:hypothetical protein
MPACKIPGLHATYLSESFMKPARTLTFKCKKCSKPVTLYLQKVSACSHIQPYQGICKCGELLRHAIGEKAAVESYLAAPEGAWSHHH